MKIKLPAVLNVLGERHKVCTRKLSCHGITYYNGLICVDSRQSADKRRDTLLHEVIHVIDNVQRLKLSERQVRLTATGLRAVFSANKNFAKFVSG